MKKPADDAGWFDKGATTSDKSGREQFGFRERPLLSDFNES
jgi:hypothetical protein